MTLPALIVATAESASVDDVVRAAIADKPSVETRRSYEHVWRFYRAWLAEQQLEPTAVRPKHIKEYITHLRLKGQKKGTIGRALSVIRTLYGALVCEEFMATNPAREVKGPKMDATPKAPWIREDADIKKLINVQAMTWMERRDLTIVRLTFGLGWRRSEVARITVEDIEGMTISATVKGNKSLTVGVPGWVAWSIVGWCAYAGINSGPLFTRRPQNRRSINGGIVYHVVRQMCVRAGIAVMPPHSLRRTYITHAGKRGVSLRDRQFSVGHASQNTTERYDKAGNTAETATGNVFSDLS